MTKRITVGILLIMIICCLFTTLSLGNAKPSWWTSSYNSYPSWETLTTGTQNAILQMSAYVMNPDNQISGERGQVRWEQTGKIINKSVPSWSLSDLTGRRRFWRWL